MLLLESIVEQRIADAAARGELDGLPGAGRPLDLHDDPLVPEELRLAYRILKNAGYLPQEVQMRCEIGALEEFIDRLAREEEQASVALRKLRLLRLELAESCRSSVQGESRYFGRLVRRLTPMR